MSRPLDIVFFDLETQRSAEDVGGWDNKRDLLMSIGVTYSTATGEYRIYSERTVDELVHQLLKADRVVGFNHIGFDYEVLQHYTLYDLPYVLADRSFDLLLEAKKALEHRVRLQEIAEGTFGMGKTADGMEALKWWRQGKIREIAEYCCFDVKVTRMVYDYAAAHGQLHFIDNTGKKQTFPLLVPG